MPATDTDPRDRPDRYGDFETDDGGVAVVDREEPEAWLRSDATTEIRA